VHDAFQRYRAEGDAGAAEEVVIAAIVDYCPPGPGKLAAESNSARLIEDLGYDSVAVAELVFFLEDLFDVSIQNEDISAISTIGELRACVVRKLAGRPGAP
jgi:acyl carrier protein